VGDKKQPGIGFNSNLKTGGRSLPAYVNDRTPDYYEDLKTSPNADSEGVSPVGKALPSG
jgi:hypothetical protein